MISNVLVVKLRYIGDVLLTTPFLRALRRGFPDARVTVLVNPGTGEVLRHNPDVDEVLSLPRTGLIPQVQCYRELRARGFDCVVDLTDGDRSAFISFMTGARVRIGFNHENRLRGRLYSRCVEASYDATHVIDYHAMALPSLGLSMESGKPVLPLSGEDHERAHHVVESWQLDRTRWIMIHPAARYWFKAWPPDRFAALGDAFHERGFQVVLVGSPDERSIGTEILQTARRSMISLIGNTRLLELAALMMRCRLFIGNDAGPMHMAAAVGCPVVALFGPSNPAVWAPRGQHVKTIHKGLDCRECFHPGCFRGEQGCMKLITVDEVLEEATALLEDDGHRRAYYGKGESGA